MQSIGICQDKLNEINRVCFRFIWKRNYDDKKPFERVKRKIICLDKEHGGLNMFNIIALQQSFYLHWADRLLSSQLENWKAIPRIIFNRIGGNLTFACNVKSKDFKGFHLLNNAFWKQVLVTWLDKKAIYNSSTIDINPNSPLFNNSQVTYKNETLFVPHCCRQSIVKVSDVTDKGEIIGLDHFRHIFGNRSDSILCYNLLYNALFKHTTELKKQLFSNVSGNLLIFGPLTVGCNTRKAYLDLIQNVEVPVAENTWSRRYERDFDKKFWLLPYSSTKETKLRILQWKILHGVYPTGILLKKMNIKDSEMCTYCNTLDTVEHFFYECNEVSNLWKEIERLITKNTTTTLSLDSQSVLLGILPSEKIDKGVTSFINELILVGKLVISKTKYGKAINPIIVLEHELNVRNIVS